MKKGIMLKKGGRLASYRHGDRAENLGIVLMQAICAVAPVPREEDMGIFDAIATVLRREGNLLFAEGSFLVQFKSAGIRKFEYSGAQLANMRAQDIPLFIASVNLKTATIELYPVGPALQRIGGEDSSVVIFHLKQKKHPPSGVQFNVYMGKPALKWDMAEMNGCEFQRTSSSLLVAWLELLKDNTQKYRLGIYDEVKWETGAIPKLSGAYAMLSGPEEIEKGMQITGAALKWLTGQALIEDSIAIPVIQIAGWYASRGVNVDVSMLSVKLMQKQMGIMIEDALAKNRDASFAQAIFSIEDNNFNFTFWIGNAGRTQKLSGSAAEILSKGIRLLVNEDGSEATIVDVTAPWIKENVAKFLRYENGVVLYERISPG